MSAGVKSSGTIGQSEVGLGAWVSSFELPSVHGPSLPRNEGCMFGLLRVAVLFVHCVHGVGKILSQKSGRVGSLESQLSQQAKAFLSPWTGCDREGEGCGERTEG